MLQLRRPIHLSIHAAGHLTTALSWPSMPSQERCSTVNMLPGPRMLCRNAHCSVGKVRLC